MRGAVVAMLLLLVAAITIPHAHALAVSAIPDNCLLSSRSSCRARAFPTHDPEGAPNLDAGTVARWAAALTAPPTPAQVVAWGLLGLLDAKYKDFLDPVTGRDLTFLELRRAPKLTASRWPAAACPHRTPVWGRLSVSRSVCGPST